MKFALLLSHLPYTAASRVHYESLLSLAPAQPGRLATLWRRLRSRFF
ncbi:hypothetical protein LJ656_22255 [Paraburkholderia sp. MMS20-SJTR3]|uniref:Uncharacterized protein n=1 Tax=Paraburkholderia sejongensis TaxID=2886946 RepID=A0ABS8JZI0_9BURK|nr:hypothetical protein [Paraburkholderia sp. MMS20-SJTR3]MCC8395315.1 hypothetical protein [Paraburkholderia sp. MMS20-SJTR3]